MDVVLPSQGKISMNKKWGGEIRRARNTGSKCE